MNVAVSRILVDGGSPGTILATTGRGLMRSADGGQRYEPIPLGSLNHQPLVTALIQHPKTPTTFFLGTEAEDGAVWRSTDSGLTWTRAAGGLPPAAAPVDFLHWNETTQALYAKAGGELFKSTDAGETFSLVGPLPPQVAALAIAPSDPRWMFAAQSSGVLYRSRDEGVTWVLNQNTLPLINGTTVVTHMIVDPKDPMIGYLAASGAGPGGGNGIYKSSDLTRDPGWSFSVIESTRERLRPVRLLLSSTGALYATARTPGEIYRNRCSTVTNGATSEIRCVDPSVGFDRICVNPDRSVPGGCVSSNFVLDIAVDPVRPGILWAGATNGIFQSRPSLVTGVGSEWNARFGFAKATLAAPELPYTFRLSAGTNGSLRLTLGAEQTADWRLAITIAAGNESWLSINPPADRTPAIVTVGVRTAGLAPGEYKSQIEVRSPDAVNSPISIPVTLTVVDPPKPAYTLTSAAGLGVPGNFGDNGPAARAAIGEVDSLTADANGNIFFSDTTYNVVRRIGADGRVERWAGTGQSGTTGDDGPAALATFRRPRGLAAARDGSLLVVDGEGRRLRRVSPSADRIATVAQFNLNLRGVAVDGNGVAFLPVPLAHALARVNPDGQIAAIAGNAGPGFRGDGLPARFSRLAAPLDAAVDPTGNIYIADTENNRIRKIDTEGIIRTVAGNGLAGFQGDAAKATDAALDRPSGIAADSAGNVFFTETEGHRLRMITAAGALLTIAGTGNPGSSNPGPTGIPANTAPLRGPTDVAASPDGSLWVSDSLNYRILKLTPVPIEIIPQLSAAPIVNSVDGSANLAPGSLFLVTGVDLASAASADAPWPNSLGDAQVLINGEPAPLSRTASGEIAGQIPFSATPGDAKLQVVFKGKPSAEVTFTLRPAAPALLTNGPARVMAILADGSVHSAENPAMAGTEIRIFLTGQGAVDPPIPAGTLAPDDPFSRPVAPIQVAIGDTEVTIADAILLPGFVGTTEVRFAIPESIEAGDYELSLTAGGQPAASKPKLLIARP